MGQKNSSLVRQVGMEFQEDVEEVRTVQKGTIFKKYSWVMGILSTCFETYSGCLLICFKKLIFKVISAWCIYRKWRKGNESDEGPLEPAT